jgi:biopolymer transport protein ExbB
LLAVKITKVLKNVPASVWRRRVALVDMGRGNGYLATIGAISPFIRLFGTVWGIMNSFIGIAISNYQPCGGCAGYLQEALLATAIGLVAAIPAWLSTTSWRMIGSYKALW